MSNLISENFSLNISFVSGIVSRHVLKINELEITRNLLEINEHVAAFLKVYIKSFQTLLTFR